MRSEKKSKNHRHPADRKSRQLVALSFVITLILAAVAGLILVLNSNLFVTPR